MMIRRNLLKALALVCAGGKLAKPAVLPRVATHFQAGVKYTIYTVTDPATFLTLQLPVGDIVLWNGLVLLPGVQYDAPGSVMTLRKLPLSAGDFITIISQIAGTAA